MANLGVACVQLTSTKDWMTNLSQALLLMERAMVNQPRLIVLPENVFLFDAKQMREVALSDATAKILAAVGRFAIENNVFVLIGSHPMAHDQFGNLVSDERVRQASILVGPDGKQVAQQCIQVWGLAPDCSRSSPRLQCQQKSGPDCER